MAGYGFNIGLDGSNVKPLTEAEAEEVADGIRTIYGMAREDMLKRVSNRLGRGVTRPGWAERKSSEILAAHQEMSNILDRAQHGRESLLEDTMARAYASGSQKFYADMGSMLGNAAHISPNAMKAGYILADLNNGLDAAHRRILRQFDDKYAGIIGAVSAEMATGVLNTREAVGRALQAFADQGITGFIDRGGHHWTLENYAEMAVLTAIERSTIAGYVDTMQSYGYDLAIIDGHVGACPDCEAWEGVIISVSGEDHRYPSLSEAESDGCFHPRCMHGITTYYGDISRREVRTSPRERRPESPAYTARSKQRYMERQIRKYKDRAIVAQTQQQKAQALSKVHEWEDALDDLIDGQPRENYMYRHKGREKASSTTTMATPSDFGIKPETYASRGISISDRHLSMMERLNRGGSFIVGEKGAFSTDDIAVLSHETGVEYTVFTIGDKSYLLRGDERSTSIPAELSYLLQDQKGTVDAHSHPFVGDLVPSMADEDMMTLLPWQDKSVIVDPTGQGIYFTRDGATEAFMQDRKNDSQLYEDLWGK